MKHPIRPRIPGPFRPPAGTYSRSALDLLIPQVRQGDSGAADRLRSAITSRLVVKFGTRRIGKYARYAARRVKRLAPVND